MLESIAFEDAGSCLLSVKLGLLYFDYQYVAMKNYFYYSLEIEATFIYSCVR